MRSLMAIGILFACAAANAGMRDHVVPREAANGGHEGAVVLWGGKVLARTVVDNQVCVEVSSRTLERNGKPSLYGYDAGQIFVACDAGGSLVNLDIASSVTFAGTVGQVIAKDRRGICSADVFSRGLDARRSRIERLDSGRCRLWMPVVAISDMKSWRDPPPNFLPAPTPMNRQ